MVSDRRVWVFASLICIALICIVGLVLVAPKQLAHQSGRDAYVPPEARNQAANWDDQGVSGIRGVDISHWDHGEDEDPVDFQSLRDQGVRFVFIKTSDSNARADEQAERWYNEDMPAAQAAGMNVGYYQYAVPTADTAKLEEQARDLATRISDRVGSLDKGELPVVLDLESAPDSLSPKEVTRFAVEWLRTAEEKTGRTPILYTNTDFAKHRLMPDNELTRFPLWQADYQKAARPPLVPGWPNGGSTFWQFSSAGRLDGKPGTLTDLNVFSGTEEQFDRIAGIN